MIERVLEHSGYLLRFRSSRPDGAACLLLHGFPAHRGTKNLDLADQLFRRFDRDVYLLHYRGLGDSPGAFRFTASVDEATEVARRVTESRAPKRSLVVVGHSWGGLVATNVAARLPDRVAALVLLSPFVFPGAEEEWIVHKVRRELPGVFGDASDDAIRADWERIKTTSLPALVAPSLAPDLPVAVLQSRLDPITPAERTRSLLSHLPGEPLYEEIALDHSFAEDRGAMTRAVASLIERIGPEGLRR
jgi:pimeloyl-ACP methyl ester carboxylesterase